MAKEGSASDTPLDPGLRLRMRGEERRIHSQHQQLGDLYRRTLGSIRSGGGKRALGDFLLFCTALEAHLTVEEDIYFPALHGLRGDLSDELSALVDEHTQLRDRLPGIQAELGEDRTQSATEALEALAEEISTHEAREEDLIARVTEGPVPGRGGNAF